MSILTLADYRTLTNTSAADGFDAYITSLIPVVESEIEQYIDRTIDDTRYYQWFNYSGDRLITLPEYPVNQILYIGYPAKVATIDYTTGNYNVEITKTGVTITDDATFAQNTYTFAANTTLADLKTAIEADYGPNMSLTIETGYTTMNSLLLRTGSGKEWTGAVRLDTNTRLHDRSDRVIEFAYNTPFVMSYSNDYIFNDELLVVWNAGWTTTTIPNELKMIWAMVIKDYLAQSKISAMGILRSQTITNYSETYMDVGVIKNILSGYAGLLDGYVKKNI
jgi:hypothetical protein